TAGVPYAVCGMATDITDRKRIEEAVRENEERYRQLADAMPQIVWSARPDGVIDYYNQRWYDFTGFARGDETDRDWASILHPEDVLPCTQRWQAAVRTGEAYQSEYRFRDRKTGSYRWHLGRALPVRDGAGRIVRWFGTCTDIDDQKRAEEALREADRRKNEFLALLGHELRNPLAPMRNALQILHSRDADSPVTEN